MKLLNYIISGCQLVLGCAKNFILSLLSIFLGFVLYAIAASIFGDIVGGLIGIFGGLAFFLFNFYN